MFKKLLFFALLSLLTLLLFTGCPSADDEADTAGIDPAIYGYWLECNASGQIDGYDDYGIVVYGDNSVWEIYVEDAYYVYVNDFVGILESLDSGVWRTTNGYSGTYAKWYDAWGYLCVTWTQIVPYYDFQYMTRYWTLGQVNSAERTPDISADVESGKILK